MNQQTRTPESWTTLVPSMVARQATPGRWLEADQAGQPMGTRLVRGAGRIDQSDRSSSGPETLREEQVRVFAAFATYLAEIATRPASEQRPPFCRIILPPRTGKTVVAGHIIDRTALTATFIVPTRALLEQTLRELARQVPGVAIGSYCGEQQRVVAHGINVVTYAMLHTHATELPAELRQAALVFVDEAHHAMTAARSAILANAFDPLAVRIALTATPDYGDDRQLAHYFPDLIHEITLDEALALGLLAPLRVWIAEVDADASRVRFVAGDFQNEQLGRLMSAGPFFRAVEVFRYDPANTALPCLVVCASRQQAYDLCLYLKRHRPAKSPAPALILGETSRDARERVLARFEDGAIDTIVQVGVLVEGWSSPRCKLLLDLAPSTSRVRATQKYFRVMTRYADHEARIVVLLPTNLPTAPVLPLDLFGGLEDYTCGQLVGRTDAGRDGRAALLHSPRTPIASVSLKSRVVVTGAVHKPTLDRESIAHVQEVLASCAELDAATCGLHRFAGLMFSHPRFTGRGDFLLRWLQVPRTREGYERFLAALYPALVADRILAQAGELPVEDSCAADRQWLLRVVRVPSVDGRPEEPFATGWSAASGGARDPDAWPEPRYIAAQDQRRVIAMLPRLKRARRVVVVAFFGLLGTRAHTRDELGEILGVSSGRIQQILHRALAQLRQWHAIAATEEALLAGPDASVIAEVARRQSAAIVAAEAARAHHLDALFLLQDHAWARVPGLIESASSYDTDAASALLDDLQQAAVCHAAHAAFEARLGELRSATVARKAFWRRWAARVNPSGLGSPSPRAASER